MTTNLSLNILSDAEISNIYDKTVEFLSKKGVQVNHSKCLQILSKAGADVDFNSHQVRFSRNIIETALRTVPHSVTLRNWGKDKDKDVILPHPDGLFYTRSNTGARAYFDVGTGSPRDLTVADVEEWGRLTEELENIDVGAFMTPRDVPVETADIHSLRAILLNTTKPIMIQPHSFQSIEYLFQLAQIAAGGEQALKNQPIVAVTAPSSAPFVFKDMDIEAIIQGTRYGVPVMAVCLPQAGATTPITLAGSVLIYSIEVLANLVMVQLIKPGFPVIGTVNFYTLEMSMGRMLTTSVEADLGSAACVQYTKNAYHIPTHNMSYGTNSYYPDGEYMIQTTFRALTGALTGCDLLGAAGRCNSLSMSNPIQLIIDNTVAGMVKRIKAGVPVNDDTLAWQDVLETAPGSDFLRRNHTLRHCREAFRSDLFVNQSFDQWNEDSRKDLYSRAVAKYMDYKKSLGRQPLSDDKLADMDNIVKKADQVLVH